MYKESKNKCKVQIYEKIREYGRKKKMVRKMRKK